MDEKDLEQIGEVVNKAMNRHLIATAAMLIIVLVALALIIAV